MVKRSNFKCRQDYRKGSDNFSLDSFRENSGEEAFIRESLRESEVSNFDIKSLDKTWNAYSRQEKENWSPEALFESKKESKKPALHEELRRAREVRKIREAAIEHRKQDYFSKYEDLVNMAIEGKDISKYSVPVRGFKNAMSAEEFMSWYEDKFIKD